MGLHRTIEATLAASPDVVFDRLADLTTYPDWLELVAEAEPVAAAPSDVGPAWTITLRAKVGPFARSKRLRMVRTVADRPSTLRFERAETDGREHAAWTLDVAIDGTADQQSEARVDLRYDGGLWTAPLEAVLGSQIDDAVPRLQELVAS